MNPLPTMLGGARFCNFRNSKTSISALFATFSACCLRMILFKRRRKMEKGALRKKYPYSALFWSVFSRIRREYVEMGKTEIKMNKPVYLG